MGKFGVFDDIIGRMYSARRAYGDHQAHKQYDPEGTSPEISYKQYRRELQTHRASYEKALAELMLCAAKVFEGDTNVR